MHLVAPVSSLASVLLLLLLALSFLDDWPLGFSSPCFSFALLPSALSYLWVLLSSYLLISVFAVHSTVLGAVDFCCLCVPICMSQASIVKSMRIVVDALCVCLRSCASVGCMFFPSPFQPLLQVINEKWTWTSQPSPKQNTKYNKKRASTEVSRKLAPWKT